MFKKMLPWLVMILIAITLITIAAFVLWDLIIKEPKSDDPSENAQRIADEVEPKDLSAKERVALTYDMETITTNLSDINYVVRLSFSFLLDNEKAKEEMELIVPQVNDIIGNILSDTAPKQIEGSAGKDLLKATIINKINPILNDGKLMEVIIRDFIITQR